MACTTVCKGSAVHHIRGRAHGDGSPGCTYQNERINRTSREEQCARRHVNSWKIEATRWVLSGFDRSDTKVKYQAARPGAVANNIRPGPAKHGPAGDFAWQERGGIDSWMGRPDGTGVQPETGPDRPSRMGSSTLGSTAHKRDEGLN